MVDTQIVIAITSIIVVISTLIVFIVEQRQRKLQVTLEYYTKFSNKMAVGLRQAISDVLSFSYGKVSYGSCPLPDDIWIKDEKLEKALLIY